jgi:hypothetical protein
MSRDSSNMRRRFASGSSSPSACDVSSSGRFALFAAADVSGSSFASGRAPPFCLAKWAASAARSSARKSRTSSASPPWPGCL